MKTPASLLAIFLLVNLALWAQDRSAPAPHPNTVYAAGDGKYLVDPDTAVIQFNISAQENTSRAAYDRASKAAEQVRTVLQSNGIEVKAAQFGFFSLQPVHNYKNPQRNLVGYRVNAEVTVKLKDFSKIAPLLDQLANMDITGDQNLSYTLEDMEAAKAKAIEDAYRKAHEAAAAVARVSGRTLSQLSYASVDISEPSPVRPLMAMGTARVAGSIPAPTAEFSPQQITITARVNALFTLK
jgi:uncharacterized protein YggE